MLIEWASLVAQLVKNLTAIQETLVQFLSREVPWRREQLPTPIFWLEFHGLYSPWGGKEPDMTEFHFSLPHWFNEIRPECPFKSMYQIAIFPTILFIFETFELKEDKSTWSIFQETHTCFSDHYNLSSTSIPHSYKSKKGNTIKTLLNSF